MKLWHDDVRPPPDDSWIWAKTNAEAQGALEEHSIAECSLDHDLGAVIGETDPDEVLYLRGDSRDGSGYDLVRWMIENHKVPPIVTIHSWNPPGAKRMALALFDAGYKCTIRPFIVE